jgi:hypothetical protein
LGLTFIYIFIRVFNLDKKKYSKYSNFYITEKKITVKVIVKKIEKLHNKKLTEDIKKLAFCYNFFFSLFIKKEKCEIV